MNTKVRLVRCPKCRNVLPELAEVPVYKCGGCGAVLQAKKPKVSTNNEALQETDPTLGHNHDHASENDASTSIQQSTDLSTEELCDNNNRNGSMDFIRDHLDCMNYDEHRSSTELSAHENADSSPDTRIPVESSQECPLNANHRVGQNDTSSEIKDPKNESPSAQIDTDKHPYTLEGHGREDEFGDRSRELPGRINRSEEKSEAVLSFHEIKESLQAACLDEVTSDKLGSRSTSRSLIAENSLLAQGTRKPNISSSGSANGDMSSESAMSPNHVRLNRSNHSNVQGFEHVNSLNTLKNADNEELSPDLSVTLGDMPKSPTHRSYYAYEASISSIDENDNQIPDHRLHQSKYDLTVSSEGLQRRTERGVNRSKWHQESEQTTRQGHHLAGDTRRLSSSSLVSESQYSPKYSKPSNSELGKMELLRMVHELQDQLNRTNMLKGGVHERFSGKAAEDRNQTFSCYDHVAPEREMHHDLNNPRYPRRYASRMAFSGEATSNRGQFERSCYHCCPQERHFSAQIPPHHIFCNEGHHGTHQTSTFHRPYKAGPSSPRHRSGSDFSFSSCETSDEQRQRKDREMKKRHFRPLAGGAPWIACYKCLKVLQLPADFLLFKRKCHSLKCSFCSNILQFSLQNNTHLLRYDPEVIAPPASEVGNSVDLSKESSFPEYHGESFHRNYSFDMEHSYLADPFGILNNSVDRSHSSGSSPEPVDERMKSALKVSSEIEEDRPRSGSPLHRLMGYASPSKVMRG